MKPIRTPDLPSSGSSGLVDEKEFGTFVRRFGAKDGNETEGEQALVAYAFVRNLRPTRTLCVGSAKGLLPAICALACKDNRTGLVDFVDAGYGLEHASHWGGVALWRQRSASSVFGVKGLDRYIRTHVTTTTAFARLHAEERYGFAVVDGDRSREGFSADIGWIWRRIDNGGFLMVPDVLGKANSCGTTPCVEQVWRSTFSHTGILVPVGDTAIGIVQKR